MVHIKYGYWYHIAVENRLPKAAYQNTKTWNPFFISALYFNKPGAVNKLFFQKIIKMTGSVYLEVSHASCLQQT
jgi:hypothetical protein